MTQVHKHEIPRKALHVSIGFLVLHFYSRGYQPTHITPFLLSAFLPITCADLLRHRIPAFNAFYIRVLGALMRESEVDSYNGTIFFLAGTYLVLRVFPKDIGVLGVLLLSWCDTAASTFGRLWGRYTPHIRKGKSLAGTAAAMFTGVASAAVFWGYIGPKLGTPFGYDVGVNAFAFKGMLQLPGAVCGYLGWNPETAKVTGGVAVGIASVVAGTVAAAAEAVDLWGWDDNLTIPVLCGVGLWGFLKTFG
ncbi:hypothetical protein P152DRAFT_457084 [Eremomyces bilateralis CBS 781.70]|uniref:Phosphatidate cytidylyltransferase n=1 Tax=Eremomyces bilateralis CBS 781.70 TaxID=1392243 RepID=A0A6G1G6Q0_9PEZI|nr:uncharacterized protein P152DRAFT_457084 [Eremomyces bilateralis CBS 781.70]KAF1813718.1 hypothetical protein P152DRAFT_457084 [Eremomyces bilateralis CBS 781.70]